MTEQLRALIKKEFLQVMRDPSCLLITLALPFILLFIFGYGISLDMEGVRTAVVLEDRSPLAESLFTTLDATKYLDAALYPNRNSAERALIDARVRAVLIIPNDFSRRIRAGESAPIQLLTDGCEANTAIILEQYVLGACAVWTARQTEESRMNAQSPIEVQARLRFNAERNSRSGLIPGSIALVMAMIGTLLTALVVAREWERGTMEAMLTTPIRKSDLILGKMIPYYLLGIGSAAICTLVAVGLFGIPFRGSAFALWLATTSFLIVALAEGLLISTAVKNQFLASQIALIVSFLPNFILSGLLFEIDSMPRFIQIITYFFPARYYVASLQTIFMAGDIWPLIRTECAAMLVIGLGATAATLFITPKRLE